MGTFTIGSLRTEPAAEHGDLLAAPVAAALASLPAEVSSQFGVVEIDPDHSDTARFTERYEVPLDASANCVVVSGRRSGETRTAGCLVLATTRVDVNGAARRRLDVRKASFAAQRDAVELTGMEYGGITPLGLPPEWPLLVDEAVLAAPLVVLGSGVRRGKLVAPGAALLALPGAEPLPGLGVPAVS
ncbi:YbaK/EbsC family protein [Actinoalloteichus spitiensis]|uniref:YbaK/EbsC family protein n=1 Tax=Actinoalloteichus spitiensis TaxID=252394 RepID=UPI0003736C50|nr:YbaK/EbsC family protein [Actinoalloteichus spitiensis]